MSQTVESRMGAVAWAIWQRSVSHPRSSNRTCPIKASGSPTGFTERQTGMNRPRAESARCVTCLRPSTQQPRTAPVIRWCSQAHRQSPRPRHLRKRTRSQGPLLRRHYPASKLLRPCPTPAMTVACRDVEAATLTMTGLPRLPEPPFQRAVPTTPADRAGARVDCFPAHTAFPKWQEGRHPHCHFRGLLRLHSRYGPPDCSAA